MARHKRKEKKEGTGGLELTGAKISSILCWRFGLITVSSPFRNGFYWRGVRRVLGLDEHGGPIGRQQVVSVPFGGEREFANAVASDIGCRY